MWWSSGRPDRISFAARRMKDVVEYFDMQSEEAKSGAAREMLHQEIQPPVADRLQIVASILSLRARTVKSHEARVHLRDVCDRVPSIAAGCLGLGEERSSGHVCVIHPLSPGILEASAVD